MTTKTGSSDQANVQLGSLKRAIPFQRTKVIGAGVLLVVAFLLPVGIARPETIDTYNPSRKDVKYDFRFTTIEAVLSHEVTPIMRLRLLLPVIIGAAIATVGVLAPSVVLGAALTGIGAVTFSLLLGEYVGPQIWKDSPSFFLLTVLPIGLGFVGILAGCAARLHCPRSRVAWAVGVAGSIVFIAGHLTPVLPNKAGGVPMAQVPDIFRSHDSLDQMMAAAFVCSFVASLLCLANLPQLSVAIARPLARWGWWLAFAALISLLIYAIIADVSHTSVVLSYAITKSQILSTGLFIPLPLGLTILLASLHKRRAESSGLETSTSGT